jgi:hypothetical protein
MHGHRPPRTIGAVCPGVRVQTAQRFEKAFDLRSPLAKKKKKLKKFGNEKNKLLVLLCHLLRWRNL